MDKLSESFFKKKAEYLARDLLGCYLVHETPEGTTSGIIVETEAYHQDDEASHAYVGETARNAAMFGPAGHAYIYFTYGMHWCFNVTADNKGIGAGALIRALQPIGGIDLMKKRRNKTEIKDLCSGPSKLVQAMGITKSDYGRALFEGSLFITGREQQKIEIVSGPRIGIKRAVNKPWRFWIKGSNFVSR